MASNAILNMIADPGAQGMARLAQTGQRNKLMEMQRGQAQEAKQTSDIAQQKAGAPILHGIVSQALQIPDDAQRAQYLAKNQQALESTGMFKLEPGDERMESLTQLQGQLEPMMRTALSAGTKAFQPVTIVNKRTGEKRMVSPTVDKAGAGSFANFKMPDNFELSRETDAEKRAADVVSKGQGKRAEVTAKGQAERRQSAIQSGLDSSDSYANVVRGIQLLDEIETGGVDAAALRVKQFFGVEGADEAELSNRMGKAVLSQLRSTFGAAFTAKEGEQLKVIEAGFGKSTEGNRRLLEQTKRLIERTVKRGIRAAKAEGDSDSVEDMEEALKFTFSGNDQAAKPPQANAQGWKLMVDVAGNKAYVGPDGQFEEVR